MTNMIKKFIRRLGIAFDLCIFGENFTWRQAWKSAKTLERIMK